MAYTGTVDIIGGLRPKNNGRFPVAHAKDIYVDEKTRVSDVANKSTITGKGAPTSTTVGVVGKMYMDVDTGNLYKCTAETESEYTWIRETKETAEIVNGLLNDENFANDVAGRVPLIKSPEAPIFADSLADMTDVSKLYVMPDGYIYAYTEFINYNLLRLETGRGVGTPVTNYGNANTRLLSAAEAAVSPDANGIKSSTSSNFVTDWFDVIPGKYYSISIKTGTDENGEDTRGYLINGSSAAEPIRMHIKLSDGTTILYYNRQTDNVTPYLNDCLEETRLDNDKWGLTIRMPDIADIEQARIQFATAASLNFGSIDSILSYEPMILDGFSAEDSFRRSTESEYMAGNFTGVGKFVSTGLLYQLPDVYEDRLHSLETAVPQIQEEISDIKTQLENPVSASPYYRDVNFGIVPDEYYRGVNSDYNSKGFGRNTTYAEVIAAYDALITGNSYVTKIALGQSSDGQTLCLYRFTPAQVINKKKPLPKIAIIAGQHGQEKGSVFGLYYFIENLLNNWQKSSVLAYLRNNVEFLIIPVVNTYGFDNWSYTNANGVNLNRNYGVNWSADGTGEQYGGEEPFDQPETQIVSALINSNRDTLLFVDFHTCNEGVAPLTLLHYYGAFSYTADSYFNRLYDTIDYNLRSIALNFNEDYTFNAPNRIYGQMASWDANGLARTWVSSQNVLGSLVEGFNGFTVNGEDKLLEGIVYKANEEVIVNWLTSAMYYLKE